MVERTTLADDHNRATTPSPARPRPVDARRRQRPLDGCRGRRVTQSHGLVPGVTGAEQEPPTARAPPAGGRRSALRLLACSPMPKRTDARTGYETSALHRGDHVTGLAPALEKFGPADLLGEPGRGGDGAARSPRTTIAVRTASTMRFPMKAAARARR